MTVKERVEKQNATIDKLVKSIKDEYKQRNCDNCKNCEGDLVTAMGESKTATEKTEYFCHKYGFHFTGASLSIKLKCNDWEGI
jgi:hypothetical protein